MSGRAFLSILSIALVLTTCVWTSAASAHDMVVKDAGGHVVGPVIGTSGGGASVLLKVRTFWTVVDVWRSGVASTENNSLWYPAVNCAGQPWMQGRFDPNALVSPSAINGPLWSVYMPLPGAERLALTAFSERRADGSCINVDPELKDLIAATFIDALGYRPPFTIELPARPID